MGTAADFFVRFMHSGMPRAPELLATAGSYIAVLDALLVTGWGAMTPQRVHVESGIATVQCNSGDTFLAHVVIEVSGAEQSELNGLTRVLTSTATSFTFATEAPDGFATGTISIKAAPVGWEKVFSGVNRAVYRSRSPRSSGVCFLVDDTEDLYAQVRGYTSMAGIDEGQGPFPSGDASIFWKSWTAGAGALRYDFFADPQFVICAVAQNVGSNAANGTPTTEEPVCFGEPLVAPMPADAYAACVIGGDMNRHQIAGAIGSENYLNNYLRASFSGPRGGGSAVTATPKPYAHPNGSNYRSGMCQVFGSITDIGSLVLGRQALMQGDAWRAFIPGLYHCPQNNVAGAVARRDTVRAAIGAREHVFMGFWCNHWGYREVEVSASYRGAFFVDITGPWREE